MVILGLALMVLGFLLNAQVVVNLGIIFILIALFVMLFSAFGALGSRKHYW